MNGLRTVDDQIFSLLNSKALITTDVTDGFKTSLNINKTELEEVQVEEFANKDGTLPRSSSDDPDKKPKQSMLEKFFEKKMNFNKRTKDKGPIITEDIEESSENPTKHRNEDHNPCATNWDEEVKNAAKPSSSQSHQQDDRRLSSEFRSQQSREEAVEPRSSVDSERQSSLGFKFVVKKT